MGSAIKISSGPLLEKKGDLTAVLTSLDAQDFFFLDEIHRLQPSMEEILYPAMEDFRVDLIIGQGPGARVHPYQLNKFTLIGATTRAGLIMAPLRSRFGIVHRLEFYTPADLLRIVQRSAKILGITMDESGAAEIARRSRGTPRVANRLLRRVRDFAEVRAQGVIDLAVAKDALAMLGVDEHGLDEVDRNLLLAIIQKYLSLIHISSSSTVMISSTYLHTSGSVFTPGERTAIPSAIVFPAASVTCDFCSIDAFIDGSLVVCTPIT